MVRAEFASSVYQCIVFTNKSRDSRRLPTELRNLDGHHSLTSSDAASQTLYVHMTHHHQEGNFALREGVRSNSCSESFL